MLDVAVAVESPWPGDDWEARAGAAARAAIERTPYLALASGAEMVEIAVRLTNDDEVRTLNRQYRHKDKSTNILSFPMIQRDLLDAVSQNSDDGEILLGDIVLAYDICVGEAIERGISLIDHVSHLIVHGCLHLLGYDHEGDAEAEAMESIERDALAALGLHDPYPVCED